MEGAQSHQQQEPPTTIRIPDFRTMMSSIRCESQPSSSQQHQNKIPDFSKGIAAAHHHHETPVLLPGIDALVQLRERVPPSSSSSIRAKKTLSAAVPALLRNSSGPRSALVLPPLPATTAHGQDSSASSSHKQHPSQEEPFFDHPEQCVLCGGTMTSSRDRKYKGLQSLAQRIERACIPTPFVYSYILNAAANERANHAAAAAAPRCSIMSPCCIACFNWIKRLPEPPICGGPAAQGEGGEASPPCLERKIIPLDNLIMFLNNPGGNCISSKVDIPVPDCRSVFRLMCHLSSETVVRPPPPSSGSGEEKHGRRAPAGGGGGGVGPPEYRLKNPYLMFFSPITERIVECFGAFYGSSEPVFVGARKKTPGGGPPAGGQQRQWEVEKESNDHGREEEEEEEENNGITDVNTEEAMYRIVYWWWESTGMPMVMPHKQCAQYVRKALRADSIRNLPPA